MEILIEKLVPGGEGLGFHEGKAVFVPGTIPGERVRVSIVESKKDFARAAVREILEPSPARREPPCGLSGVCGGCDWLHIAYSEQLELKKSMVRETMQRIGGLEPGGLEIEQGPPLGYRNRIQVHRNGEGRLGFMGSRSGLVVPVETCPVAEPTVDRVFREPPPVAASRFTAFGREGALAWEGSEGAEEIEVPVGGKGIVFSVRCFFQSNLALLEKLVPYVTTVLAGSGGPGTNAAAADLYCGVGIFAAHVSGLFSRVIGVESDSLALSYARRNAPGQGNDFYALTVEDWIAKAGEVGFDSVIVDPPRAGLSRKVLDFLKERPPANLAYVSCNPVTLARDLGALLSGVFVLKELRLFDFFPQTSHVESVARLEARA
jgi:23S rRNA (uracil1939-C5)-methyltransferase